MNLEINQGINNVKISIIFLSEVKIEQFKKSILSCYNDRVSYKKNIIVLRIKYTCTIFYKPPGKYHVNVTKIKSLQDVDDALQYLRTHLFHSLNFQLVKQTIDNISANFRLNSAISLHTIARTLENASFNHERFPVCFVGFDNTQGKAIIFSSGCVNILGCKNAHQIESIWKKLKTQIKKIVV